MYWLSPEKQFTTEDSEVKVYCLGTDKTLKLPYNKLRIKNYWGRW